ncbi:transglycosylase SLT domain-containing protein [Xylophilus sp.]|uniref:transglycosylase SLT domain-containing protein n=1 Tax=Xylophilus sp. TaxID=2653893 RepID=UPI0013BA7B74|nr:transglycosylase SLT domain-containing protein [Xylophilus sp.]KAF1047178.1 MAG: Membrane-bound lytic murein transglycosylase D [Xylophilus sp.]
MKLMHAAALAAAVALTGCANTSVQHTPGENTSQAPAGSAPGNDTPSHKPIVYNGPLRPITAQQASNMGVFSASAPADLWDRIRRGFAMPDLDNDLVHDREQWYATRPDYIQRMTERSSKYLFHVVEELEVRGMPTELALLPFIESAFNPQAVSSAKAAGMWQFMPATGSDFQLKQNMFRDDRRDVIASTRAALDYLQRLYGMFGDWQLALAAYNWGEGSVSRAIARNQKLGLGTSYSELNMPNETRYYVPKLQAVKNIVANPAAFGTELPPIENHPYFQTVEINRDIDVALAARLADVRIEDFRALNPAAHRPVILAAGTPQILLPWDNARIFQRNFDAYKDGQYASWTAWTAPTTMTVAQAAQRVSMSEAALRSTNAIPPRMLIKAGSTLIVPRSAKMDADVPGEVADNGRLALAPEIVTRRTVVKAGKRESVASVARRYRVSPANVASWNDVKPTAWFRHGEQVVVYLPVQAAAPAARATRGAPAHRATAKVPARATKQTASRPAAASPKKKR